MFAFVFASFSFFHFCRRSCFHIARPAIDFIITKMNGERRKEKFREDKRFYRLPTKRLCVLRALSAAEAKTSMTLRIFPPAFSSQLSLFRGIFFCSPREIFLNNAHHSSLSLSLCFYFLFTPHRCALTTTALNLLPVGQLDGGRVAQAAFGRRVLSATSLGTYLGLTFGILGSTLSLPWLIFILICQRTPDYAPKDDVTEVDESRATLAFACIAVAFLILLPGASLTPSDLGPMDF